MSDITRPSLIVSDSNWMSLLWLTVSKYFSKSISTTYLYPSVMFIWHLLSASWALLFGRNPKLLSENCLSKIGVRIWHMACWISLSTTVGIPSFLVFPFLLGISTLRTGFGRYFPSRRDCSSSSRFLFR